MRDCFGFWALGELTGIRCAGRIAFGEQDFLGGELEDELGVGEG
ncbi:hypothetical protein VDG1235_594 [Verrucomicrobiia bacterium DG1235]|nr:hypothetical protein VDG1235_594 [Verrucomicrobiae bacterium DG1235]